jgi:hypothetical protein
LRVFCPTAMFHVEPAEPAEPTEPAHPSARSVAARHGIELIYAFRHDDVCNDRCSQHPHRPSSPCALH